MRFENAVISGNNHDELNYLGMIITGEVLIERSICLQKKTKRLRDMISHEVVDIATFKRLGIETAYRR